MTIVSCADPSTGQAILTGACGSYWQQEDVYQSSTAQAQNSLDQAITAFNADQSSRIISQYVEYQVEYQALMNAGVAYAKAYGIAPGVSLSAAQMALVTTDMVLLTTQTLTLPDGSTRQVLVPQVYLAHPQGQDLTQGGALIAGGTVTLPANLVHQYSGELQAIMTAYLTGTSPQQFQQAGAAMANLAVDVATVVASDGVAEVAGAGTSATLDAVNSGLAKMGFGGTAAEDAAGTGVSATGSTASSSAFYRDGSIADPSRPMSVAGSWRSAAELTPAQADQLVQSSLPAGAEVSGARSADTLNKQAVADGDAPPHLPGSQVLVVTTTQPTQMVRVYVETTGRSKQVGSWIMPASEIAGLTPQQIASKFGLPQVPTMVSDVSLPVGTKLQASVANGISPKAGEGILTGDNGGGGGVQFQIRNAPGDPAQFRQWFSNARPLP